MSGGGGGDDYGIGGGGGGGSGGGGGEQTDCANLRYRTTLNSPVPAVVGRLRAGDELSLNSQSQAGPILAQTARGDTAGSIAGLKLVQLLKCMANGYSYKATVLRVNGGNVEVEVHA